MLRRGTLNQSVIQLASGQTHGVYIVAGDEALVLTTSCIPTAGHVRERFLAVYRT
jgi:hypothetical protein